VQTLQRRVTQSTRFIRAEKPVSATTSRIHGLHDFRMEDVEYSIVTLGAGQILERPAGIAGYFYHVLNGHIEIAETGRQPLQIGHRDTAMVEGHIRHAIYNNPKSASTLLIGAEPFEHLSWLGSNTPVVCHRVDSGHPLMKRLLLAMDLVIEEITNPDTAPDQLTLERTAELILFYFFRLRNPVTGKLDAYPWADTRMVRAVTAMNNNPTRQWTLDQLAEIATMSRSAFAERFKSLVGETPMQLLASIRLKYAARLLLEGHTIQRTAMEAGYGSEESFNRAFKRYFSITPGRWIRERRAC